MFIVRVCDESINLGTEIQWLLDGCAMKQRLV